MTSEAKVYKPERADRALPRRRWLIADARTRLLLTVVVVVIAAFIGLNPLATDPGRSLLNDGGPDGFAAFFAAALNPNLDAEFLEIVWHSTIVTIACSIVGIVIAIGLGFIAALLITGIWRDTRPESARTPVRSFIGSTLGWNARGAAILTRSFHELLWAMLLITAVGGRFIPGILALALPSAGILAKLFSEILDEVGTDPIRALRTAGARPAHVLAYAIVPGALPQMVSYGLYRTECMIRSAAILGWVGVPGIGFEMMNSFQDLHYREVWTLLYALLLLMLVLDVLSTVLRRWLGRS